MAHVLRLGSRPARSALRSASNALGGAPNPLGRAARHAPTSAHHLGSCRRALSLASACHRPSADRRDPRQKPLVILHGLFGSKQNSRSVGKALARDLGADTYAVDLRNHGDSPHDVRHDYLSMAADVEEFMAAQGLGQATLIGHSMGAKVAMTLALQSPEKVHALVPVDNAPVDAALKNDFGRYVQGMREVLRKGVGRQSEADEILRGYEESLPIRQFLLTNLVRDTESKKLKFRVPLDILGPALNSMGDFPFKDPHEARYNGRTLMVRGSKSSYVPDDVLPLVGEFFPRFEVRDIDAGHWVISEKPDDFRRAVVEFLTVDE